MDNYIVIATLLVSLIYSAEQKKYYKEIRAKLERLDALTKSKAEDALPTPKHPQRTYTPGG